MQNATTVLNIIREQGKRGIPLQRIIDNCTTEICIYEHTPNCTPMTAQ